MSRKAHVERVTKETKISVTIDLDGTGDYEISTGIGFFDHMLEGFAKHGLFDLSVLVEGDLHVDDHHTVEDTGIVLGNAIAKALGDKKGIVRYGDKMLPMDEVLVSCAVDLGGRPYLSFDDVFDGEMLGSMNSAVIREFFYALSYSAMMNIHLHVMEEGNAHHMAEAMFKAFAKALSEAVRVDDRIAGVLSTKGAI